MFSLFFIFFLSFINVSFSLNKPKKFKLLIFFHFNFLKKFDQKIFLIRSIKNGYFYYLIFFLTIAGEIF